MGTTPWHSIIPQPVSAFLWYPPQVGDVFFERSQERCGPPPPPVGRGVSLAVDVAVCHPAPLSLFPLTPEASTRIVHGRASRKDRKYGARCTAASARFEPFVLTTWGSWGPGAESVWKDLVRRLAGHRRGKARSQLMEELLQGLSHALAVGIGKQLHSIS